MKRASMFILALLIAAVPVIAQSGISLELPDELTLVFRYENPDATSVNVAGPFQGWDPEATPMTEESDGVWVYRMPVSKSDNITFKYVVDGEYLPSMEGLAPAVTEDGYGGKNGVVSVIDLMDASGEADDVFRTSITFGTYTQFFTYTDFLTHAYAPEPDGSYLRGLEANKSTFNAKSYWKLGANILPGIDTYLEIKAFDGSITMYEQDPDPANPDPLVSAQDGFWNMYSALFGPFYAFNSNSQPSISHFKAGLSTPYVDLSTGYVYAKSDESSRDRIWETFNNGADANNGYLEITNGSQLATIGTDIGLDAMIGLTERTGSYGIYSWADFNLGDIDAGLFMNMVANGSGTYPADMFVDGKYTYGAGADMSFMDGSLKATVEAISTIDNNIPFDAQNGFAAGFDASYTLNDMFSTGAYAKWVGQDVTTIYGSDSGDDDGNYNLEPGIFRAGVTPQVTPMSLLTLGVSYEYVTDHLFAGTGVSESAYGYDLSGTYIQYLKPELTLHLGEVLPVSADVYGYSHMALYDGATESFSFNAAGGTVTLNDLAAIAPAVILGYDFYRADDNWGQVFGKVEMADLSDSINSVDVTVAYLNETIATVAEAGIGDNIGLDTAIVYRLTSGEPSPFGMSVGANITLNEAWRLGVAFIRIGYDLNPYDGSESGSSISMDGYYPNDLNGGGFAFLNFGIGWDF